MSLSVLVVARNEERQIAACLDSAAFADEIVVVLDRSTDATKAIAEAKGARVIEGSWPLEGKRRMAGIEACKSDWIIELDADERISAELREELGSILPVLKPGHYVIDFHNYVGGVFVRWGWGGYNGVAAKAALFSRGMKSWGEGEVHPQITLSGDRGRLTGHIDHYVDDNIEGMYARLNRYTTAAARDVVAKGKIPTARSTFRRFLSRFMRSYLYMRGYREGWRGIALALFAAMYPVLVYLKAREAKDRSDVR